MTVIGVDPSLNASGVVVLKFIEGEKLPEILKQCVIPCTPKMGDVGRIIHIVDELDAILNSVVDPKVAVEGLSFGARGRAMLQLAALNYYIQIHLVKKEIEHMLIPPTVMKKFVTGKGNCTKDLTMLKAYKKWGVDFGDNNICDAYCHAMYYYYCKKVEVV